jgi:enamine deaminase RidA (YjgF/YER057c/UK114 family)
MIKPVRHLHPELLSTSNGKFSPGVKITNPSSVLFIAGQIAADRDGATVGENDIKAQTRQVFSNIKIVLSEAEMEFVDIVKFTTYIVGADNVEGFVGEREKLWPELYGEGPFPANTLVVIDRLARPQFLLEIEAIAMRGGLV